nr:hypothetical protein [Tanacetum cinerariifolium]
MVSLRQLHSHLKRLSQNDLQGSRKEFGFKRAFATLSGQEIETFTGTMFLNVEQLEKQLDKEYFQEIGSMAGFNVLETQFQMFITNQDYLNDEYVAMTRNYFIQYTQQAILEFRDTLIQHLESVKKSIDERVQLKREYDSWVNERQMQTTEEKVDTSKALDASSVDTESSTTESKEQDTSSRSGNDAHDDDANIRPIYDEEPTAEVQMTAEINVTAIGQQPTKQPKFNNEGEPRCDSQVDVNNDLSKPVTTHCLPKEKEAASTKPHHMIASRNSRISTKNMTRVSSNDMVHNRYLEEAKKMTQEQSRNSEPSLIPSARSQSTTNEVNSRATVPSNKTPKRNKPVEQIGVPNKQERQIPTGHRFSIQKSSVVQKKTMTPRSSHRWKPTGKIFKTVGLRWVPTGKIFTSSITKVDSEPLNGSDVDITNQYECEQTLDVSAGTLNLSAGTSFNLEEEGLRVCSELGLHDHSNEQSSSKLVPDVVPPVDKTTTSRQVLELLFHPHITASDYDNPDPVPQRQDVYSSADADVPSQHKLDMLFGPLYDEFFNAGSNPLTNIQSTSASSTDTNVHAKENNNDQAKEGKQLHDNEFTNPLCASTQVVAEYSSHNIDLEMCMYALTVSIAVPKNIKEAMANL